MQAESAYQQHHHGRILHHGLVQEDGNKAEVGDSALRHQGHATRARARTARARTARPRPATPPKDQGRDKVPAAPTAKALPQPPAAPKLGQAIGELFGLRAADLRSAAASRCASWDALAELRTPASGGRQVLGRAGGPGHVTACEGLARRGSVSDTHTRNGSHSIQELQGKLMCNPGSPMWTISRRSCRTSSKNRSQP